MAPPRRPFHWRSRGSGDRRYLLLAGLVCLAAVLVEVGALTGWFGLGGFPWGSRGPSVPNLNPDHERILAITGNTTYFGSVSGYFPAITGTSLCGPSCPELPRIWPSDGILPAEVGVFFYYNVTNTAKVDVNLSMPVLATSGANPTLFFLQTFCCYSTVNPPYVELIDSSLEFPPQLTLGFEGYAYTTVDLPATASGGYSLFVNFTAD